MSDNKSDNGPLSYNPVPSLQRPAPPATPPPPFAVDKPKFTMVGRQNRIYTFPNGNRVEIKGISSINVSKSGTHRINTTDGKKHIVSPGWLHIEFDATEWTF